MLSFWEKDTFLSYDYVVVGGGIVGLSTAVSIKEESPKASVLVLERSTFPTGASTKNAGFACFGSLTEILHDLETMPRQEVFDLVKLRWEGLGLLRKRLGDTAIDYQNHGGYELLMNQDPDLTSQIDNVNGLLYPLFEQEVYQLKSEGISEFGFNEGVVKELIFNPLEAQIHTGKMMKSLQNLAQRLGVEVYTGTSVNEVIESETGAKVICEGDIGFLCRKVAVCTNAFSKKLLPGLDLEPGRGVVLVTKPIEGLPFKGTYHYDGGYFYFRNYGDRVIFGGGRNLDLKGEATTDFEIKEMILDRLKSDLAKIILPNSSFEVEQVWAGVMAFGKDKRPILEKTGKHTFIGVRLGGMGVAIGSKLGQELAKMMCST